jgi:hypothetical protein
LRDVAAVLALLERAFPAGAFRRPQSEAAAVSGPGPLRVAGDTRALVRGDQRPVVGHPGGGQPGFQRHCRYLDVRRLGGDVDDRIVDQAVNRGAEVSVAADDRRAVDKPELILSAIVTSV